MNRSENAVKILIIEDNEEVRENTSEILELSGYTVLTAENGKSGVELARSNKLDLIICDIMMPVLDGYGVLQVLSKHEETAGIPFIFLTAKSEAADFRKGMESGADDYLTKPFQGTELLNAVRTRLLKSSQLRQIYARSADGVRQFLSDVQQSGKITLTSGDNREICLYKKRHVLYMEGQRPRYVFYVISGKVKLYKTNEEGKELIMNIIAPDQFFGYSYILESLNYGETAMIMENSELMLIPKDDFLSLISSDIKIASDFIRIITRNVLEKEELLVNFAYSSLRKKVAYALIQLLEKSREEQETEQPVIDITRKNMAGISGVATESLIRTLADFKDERLINIENGKLLVLSENKLRNLRN